MARNGTRSYLGGQVGLALMPYGMREIDGYGKNVWEFFNRTYDVIGLPFRLAKKPTDQALCSVSWNKNCDLFRDGEAGRIVFFAPDSVPCENVMMRVVSVMKWKLHNDDGELRDLPAQVYPHSFCKTKSAQKHFK